MQSLHLFELNLIKSLQLIRTPFLDKLFLFCNYFDTPVFPLIVIPIIWFAISWKWGSRIMYLLIINNFINGIVKSIFAQPRPIDIDPSVGLLFLKSYGFPSGAAQAAMIYSGLMIFYFKNKKWAWILSIVLIFFVSLSRIYLGVHFISDVLGGLVLGYLIVLLFYIALPKIEKELSKKSYFKLFVINFIFSVILFILGDREFKYISVASFFAGIGLMLSKKVDLLLPLNKFFLERIYKVILCFLGLVIIIYMLIKLYSIYSNMIINFIAALSISLWISFIVSFLWKKVICKFSYFKKYEVK